MRCSAGVAIDNAFRTAGEVGVALFHLAISGGCVALCIYLAIGTYGSPAPPACDFASLTVLIEAIFALEEGLL